MSDEARLVKLALYVLNGWDSAIEDMELRGMHLDPLYQSAKRLYRQYEPLVDAEVVRVGREAVHVAVLNTPPPKGGESNG